MKIYKYMVDEIIKLSLTKRHSEIAEIYGVCTSNIGKILRKNNINTKRTRLNLSRLKFNINYFDDIDTEEKAYWLGFIAADGCLKNNKVNITSKDKEIIVKFKKALKSEHKIVENIAIDKRTNKKHKSFSISITNCLFTKKLEKYININKSNIFYLPNIDNTLYSYFIAGMFDGDGSLTIYHKYNYIKLNLISTKECLEQIQDLLIEVGVSKLKTDIVKCKTIYKMYLYKDAFRFLNYIYNEASSNIYLSRKYEKFKKYKNEREENTIN